MNCSERPEPFPNNADQRWRRRDFLGLAAAIPFASDGIQDAHTLHTGQSPDPVAPQVRVQRLAWAGVRLELPSTAIFIDPLNSAEVWGTALKDSLSLPTGGADMRAVLVTHMHPDHFDPPAIAQLLGNTGTLVCEARIAAAAGSRGFRVRGLDLFEPAIVGDFIVTPVPAVDGYGDSQVSWVVQGGGRRVIHCGDTLWHGHWWQVGRQLGPFDVAFLPINGARFSWRRPFAEVASVMTPEQAVAAAVVLGAKCVIPIHYGVSGAAGYEEYPQAETKLIETAKQRKMATQVLKAGEWVKWEN